MKSRWPIVVAILFLLSACRTSRPLATGAEDASAEPMGRMILEITDAPFDLDFVSTATMTVDRITIYRQVESDVNPIVLYSGSPITLNLLELRDGITQLLADRHLPAGTYKKIRMRVTSARLVLVNGRVYRTQSYTLWLTGYHPLGFRVLIDPPFVVPAGGTIHALLDIDLANSFLPIPPWNALNAWIYLFKAKIRAMNLSTTGGIHGSVLRDDGAGGSTPVESATIYVLPPGATDLETAVTSTTTGPTGNFAVHCLPPGAYDVLAVKLGDEERLSSVPVTIGTSTAVEIRFPDAPSAGIFGTVFQVQGGGLLPVLGATVYVLPPSEIDPATAIATATTDANGLYSIQGLEPGFVNVLARKDALATILFGIELISGTSIQQNLTIQ